MSELDSFLKNVYGKDVVDNAYASPAGKLTKAEARVALEALILSVVDNLPAESITGSEYVAKETVRNAFREEF